MIAKSSALSTFDLASACLGAVRRRAGGSQADGSSLPRARCGRRLGLNRQAIRRMSGKGVGALGAYWLTFSTDSVGDRPIARRCGARLAMANSTGISSGGGDGL